MTLEATANSEPATLEQLDLAQLNAELEVMNAEQRVAWALACFPGHVALTSSFGAQAAVCLHMATQQQSDIPVILVDTGYLFKETYINSKVSYGI